MIRDFQFEKIFLKMICFNRMRQTNGVNKNILKTMTLFKTCIMYLKLPEIFFCFVFENLFDLRITKVRANKIKMTIVLYNHKIRSDIV